ncbi:MAG: hypothetical protein QM747_21295 [Nocardioides sp.]
MLSVGRVSSVSRRPAVIAGLAGVCAVALRLPFLHDAPFSDEGGLLVVAGQWHGGGPYLYGSLFVDRPPLLLLFFKLSEIFGGLVAVRVLGLGIVLAAVAGAYRAGARLGGPRGAVLAAITCAALLADPRLGTREVDAETVGVPLVLLTAVLALEAVQDRSTRARGWLLTGAGAAGTSALLVKQNLADGLVFAVVLVVLVGLARPLDLRGLARGLGRLGLGALAPLTVALAWSTTSTGPWGLWYSLYAFRFASSSYLFGTGSPTRTARLHALAHAALLSGLVVLVVVCLATLLARRRDAITAALAAMLATEVVGVAGGGYYWSHYLIGLVPATALLVARCAEVVRREWLVGLLVGATAVSTLVATQAAVARRDSARLPEVTTLTTWLDAAQRPGDSAVVLYGEAALFEESDLRPAYPFLWTLPQRVMDRNLSRLVRTLTGPDRPTFVVVRMTLDPWGQDPTQRVPHALAAGYDPIANICGDTIYLRIGAVRPRPAPPSCYAG